MMMDCLRKPVFLNKGCQIGLADCQQACRPGVGSIVVSILDSPEPREYRALKQLAAITIENKEFMLGLITEITDKDSGDLTQDCRK